ncbi:MAG: hypothetical protein Q9214_003688 [Letrouitia sp. 1 TL-2023]
MALVLAAAASLQPEARLDQALAEYEAILSDEDKIQFHNQGVPDSMAAIRFTILIDSKCNDRRRQCMGPRLITFLESVQHFSGVVDTFVSSKPQVAALAANNFTSYFEQLSIFLMNLGKQTPRVQGFGSLYPSTELRKALCDYYAAIIRLCKYSTEFLRQPVYMRLPKVLLVSFKDEFGPYEKEIARLCQDIRDEVSLASKRAQKQENELQAKERLEASKHRNMILKFNDNVLKLTKEDRRVREEVHQRRLEKKKQETLGKLSTYDYQKTYKQIRKECIPGTSNWILETTEFKSWMEDDQRVLWCSGKCSGKSVISACVAAGIMASVAPKDVTSYFFCRFDDEESLQAKNIFGSIARQLVSDLSAEVFVDFNQGPLDGPAILKLLENSLSNNRRYFIILDGLDECNETQMREVAEALYHLLNSSSLHIKVFWSSRSNVMSWLSAKFEPQQRVHLDAVESQKQIAHDIREFINTTLEEWLDGDPPELQIWDPTLVLSIIDHLETEAHGMFLWVKFQLWTLREKQSDDQILAAMERLPRNLPEMFERILSKFTEVDDMDIGSKIFRWTAVVKRPLTVDEMREAIGIKPLQETWNPGHFINDMKKALVCCGNLVFVDEEQQTIHFTHSSVKKYLCDNTMSLSRYYIDLEEADKEAGAVCITYLNFPNFKTQVTRASNTKVCAADITSMVVKNSLPPALPSNKVAQSLLRKRGKSSKPVNRLLEDAIGDSETNRQQRIIKEQFLLLPYARQFWLEHTKRITPGFRHMWTLWSRMVEDACVQENLPNGPWTIAEWNECSTKVIEWIVDHNHCSLAHLIVDFKKPLHDSKLCILVEGATSRGYIELLKIGLNNDRSPPLRLQNLLLRAARNGHLATAKLLSQKFDINTTLTNGFTALQVAARSGRLAVVEMLLQLGAHVDGFDPTHYGGTALQQAANQGHLAVVERLLQQGANVNTKSTINSRTVLQAAAEHGHLAIVERLLREDIDIEDTDKNGRTALQAAAEHGHLAIVERLLREGVDIDHTDENGRTALSLAAKLGHLPVVERLLQMGADATQIDHKAMVKLNSGVGGYHPAVVERLLQEIKY